MPHFRGILSRTLSLTSASLLARFKIASGSFTKHAAAHRGHVAIIRCIHLPTPLTVLYAMPFQLMLRPSAASRPAYRSPMLMYCDRVGHAIAFHPGGKSLDSSNENGGISLICCFTFPFSCIYLICPLPACASLSRSPENGASFSMIATSEVMGSRYCVPLRLRGFAHDLARCGLAFPCLAFHASPHYGEGATPHATMAIRRQSPPTSANVAIPAAPGVGISACAPETVSTARGIASPRKRQETCPKRRGRQVAFESRMTAMEALPFPKASKATMETISIRMNAMSIQASRRAMIRVTRTSSRCRPQA